MHVPIRIHLGSLVLAEALLAACGGGGSGGGGATVPQTTATTPAASNGVTLLSAYGSALVARVAPSSNDAVVLAQAATTPTEPSSGASLTQYAATITDAAGTTGASAQRAAASARAAELRARILENRDAERADGLREQTLRPERTRALLRGLTAQPARATSSTRTTRTVVGTVGTQRQFFIITSNIGNSGGCAAGTGNGQYQCAKQITATLEAAGAHGNIWVDDASLATAGEFTNVPSEFQQVAADFDRYWQIETNAFAQPFFSGAQPIVFGYSSTKTQCDTSGNPLPASQYTKTDLSSANNTSIDIVITDALAGTGEGGYYYIVDEFPQSVWECASAPKPLSNNTSMFVLTGNNYTSGPNLAQFNETYWLNTDVPRSLSHEFQHLLHAHYKVLRAALNGQPQTADDSFVDEGMSMLAEDLATDPAPGQHIDTPRFTYSFMLEPSLYSLTSFTAYQPNPTSTATNPPYGWYSNTAGSYGQAYLFQRYLYDRFGDDAIQSIYNSTQSSVNAVSAAAGEPFAQLYREFATAVAAQNTPYGVAPFGFSNAVTLRGTVTVPSRRSGSLSTRTLTFGGPQPPETFGNALPNGFLTIAPGTTATTFIVDGGTLFLPAANGASGSTVGVTAAGTPSFQGSSVQGALPTPAPSSQ
ncbi:hypothetical protein WPS_24440 [Vulcanimicrobium alpinum]|uniref:Peptidase M30 n=1 Tax=Vulcanimicrobium alpinum TaxID=3016050 RepID=A0AAN2CAP7_UNVUL|nr:hypothetical protein [Vulcanimicrobium alpinum]BDE07168.1 hypothetical protein WPS_24440 [Vulcanimicrobium alpinum]